MLMFPINNIGRLVASALLIASLMLASLIGCKKTPEAQQDSKGKEVVAKVEGKDITRQMLMWYLEYNKNTSLTERAKEIFTLPAPELRPFVEDYALAKAAGRHARDFGLDKTTSTLQMANDAKNQLILMALYDSEVSKIPTPTEDEIKAFHDSKKTLFKVPASFSMRHIFISNYENVTAQTSDTLESLAERISGSPANAGRILVDNDSKSPRAPGYGKGTTEIAPLKEGEHLLVPVNAQKRAENQKKIEAARARLLAGEPFGKVASEVSQANIKGELIKGINFTGRPILPEIAKAANDTPVGQITPIFETKHGFNIMKIEEKRDESVAPVDEVRDEIIQRIKGARQEDLIKNYVDGLFKIDALKINYAAFKNPATPPDTIVVTVGNKKFTNKEMQVESTGKASKDMTDDAVLTTLKSNNNLRNALLLFQAESLDLSKGPRYEMNYSGVVDAQLRGSILNQMRGDINSKQDTPEEQKAYYENHKAEFTKAPTYTYYLLALKVSDTTDTQKTPAAAEIQEALHKVGMITANVKDPDVFRQLVGTYSQAEESKSKGGLIENAPSTTIAPELLSQLDAAKPNQMTQPVIAGQYAVVAWFLSRKEGGVPSYEEIKPQLPQLIRMSRLSKFQGKDMPDDIRQQWLAEEKIEMQ